MHARSFSRTARSTTMPLCSMQQARRGQASRKRQVKERSVLIREAVEGAEMMRTLARPFVSKFHERRLGRREKIQIGSAQLVIQTSRWRACWTARNGAGCPRRRPAAGHLFAEVSGCSLVPQRSGTEACECSDDGLFPRCRHVSWVKCAAKHSGLRPGALANEDGGRGRRLAALPSAPWPPSCAWPAPGLTVARAVAA